MMSHKKIVKRKAGPFGDPPFFEQLKPEALMVAGPKGPALH